MPLDPRLSEAARSVNDRLMDDAIRHAVLLERLKSGEVRRILQMLRDTVLPDLLAKIDAEVERTAGAKRPSTRLRRLQKAAVNISQAVRGAMKPLRAAVRAGAEASAELEAEMALRALRRRIPAALNVSLSMPSPATLRQLVTKLPFEGGTLGQWMSGFNRRLSEVARRELTSGIAQGASVQDMTRNIRRLMTNQSRRHIESIVRTATTHATSKAREATYGDNGDVVKGVRWVSTLDSRTTMTCMALDGKVFDVGEGPRPPAHFNCRSTTVPVLKSWQELGISAKDVPASIRASMNGQVPADVTYGDWLKRQGARIQDEALGRVRGRLFRAGKLDIRDLTGRRWQPLTLKQVKRRLKLTEDDVRI